MKEIKLNKLGFSLTPQMFDMNVDASALYQTNATELYRRALIGEDSSRSKFSQIYGIKDRVKLGVVDFTNVLKPGACDWDPTDSDIAQKTFEVCPIMMGTSFCVEDLEISFVSDQIGKGSMEFKEPAAFMNYFYETLSAVVSEELEYLTWQGIAGSASLPDYLQVCDGLEYLLSQDVDVLGPTAASPVTSTNVISKLIEARNAMPTAVKNSKDYVYMVSVNVYEALLDAVSDNKNSGLYFIENYDLKFQGVPVVKIEGASDDVIVAGETTNFLFITDLLADVNGWNVVDFMKTTLNRRIGVRTDAKVKFDYKKGDEIFFHKP